MRCLECGTRGYSRTTKTPEWRCSKCGHEWDIPPNYHASGHCPKCGKLGRKWSDYLGYAPLSTYWSETRPDLWLFGRWDCQVSSCSTSWWVKRNDKVKDGFDGFGRFAVIVELRVPYVSAVVRRPQVEEKPRMKGFMGFILSSAEKDWDDLSILEKMISGPIVALLGAAFFVLVFAWTVSGIGWAIAIVAIALGPLYALLVLWRKIRKPSDPD